MSIATYLLAIFIGNILDFIRYPPRRLGGGGKKPRSADPLNIWTLLGSFFKAIFNWPADDVNPKENDGKHTQEKNPEARDQSSQSVKTLQGLQVSSQGSKNEQRLQEEGKVDCILQETDGDGTEPKSKKFRIPLLLSRKRES